MANFTENGGTSTNSYPLEEKYVLASILKEYRMSLETLYQIVMKGYLKIENRRGESRLEIVASRTHSLPGREQEVLGEQLMLGSQKKVNWLVKGDFFHAKSMEGIRSNQDHGRKVSGQCKRAPADHMRAICQQGPVN